MTVKKGPGRLMRSGNPATSHPRCSVAPGLAPGPVPSYLRDARMPAPSKARPKERGNRKPKPSGAGSGPLFLGMGEN